MIDPTVRMIPPKPEQGWDGTERGCGYLRIKNGAGYMSGGLFYSRPIEIREQILILFSRISIKRPGTNRKNLF